MKTWRARVNVTTVGVTSDESNRRSAARDTLADVSVSFADLRELSTLILASGAASTDTDQILSDRPELHDESWSPNVPSMRVSTRENCDVLDAI
jgi:hypothetical protein